MTAIDAYRHLWDGSEPGWKIHHIERVMWRITFAFEGDGPTECEVAAMRILLDEFRNIPAVDVWRRLRGCASYTAANEQGNIDSRSLIDAALNLGLSARAEPIDRGGYIPVSPDGTALVIEDDEIAGQVTQKMIAAGIPVEIVHVD